MKNETLSLVFGLRELFAFREVVGSANFPNTPRLCQASPLVRMPVFPASLDRAVASHGLFGAGCERGRNE